MVRPALFFAFIALSGTAFATSGMPVGTFGIWQVVTAPPMLPRPGETMRVGGYAATAKGQNLNWRLTTQESRIQIESFAGKPCEEIEIIDFSPTKPLTTNLVLATLVRQTRTVEECLKAKPAITARDIAQLKHSRRAVSKILAIMNGIKS